MRKSILSTIFVIVFSVSANAAMPPSFRTGRLTLQAEADYFWTTANYDLDGETQKLLGDNSYNILMNTFSGTYFFEDAWALTGGLGYAYATSSSVEQRTNGALTNVFGRGQKLFTFSKFRLIPEAEISVTLDPIDEDRDEALTNEGTNSVKLGSWLTADLWRLRAYGYVGYHYQDDGRASLMPWTGGLALRQQKWFFSGELAGYESITDDEYTDQRFQRTSVTSQVNAGSLRYYSVNPRLVEARVQTGFEFFKSTLLSLGYGQTLMGESTAKGQNVFLIFSYNIEPASYLAPKRQPRETTDKVLKSKRPLIDSDEVKTPKTDDRDKNFEPVIEEDYDESLFEEDI